MGPLCSLIAVMFSAFEYSEGFVSGWLVIGCVAGLTLTLTVTLRRYFKATKGD